MLKASLYTSLIRLNPYICIKFEQIKKSSVIFKIKNKHIIFSKSRPILHKCLLNFFLQNPIGFFNLSIFSQYNCHQAHKAFAWSFKNFPKTFFTTLFWLFVGENSALLHHRMQYMYGLWIASHTHSLQKHDWHCFLFVFKVSNLKIWIGK